MISFQDNKTQSMIDTIIGIERPYYISACDSIIMGVVDYDLSEAERHLKIWLDRHEKDCSVEGKNPLTLKIFPTFFEDPEQKVQRDRYVDARRRRFRK